MNNGKITLAGSNNCLFKNDGNTFYCSLPTNSVNKAAHLLESISSNNLNLDESS